MDVISFSEAATANSRIESFIENPDSTSGIVTVPKVIASGETITIPAGRIAVLPNLQVDGVLNIEGEVFIPSGATFGDLEMQLALKADTSYVNNKYSGFKNYIINGNFDVWQYATSQTTSGYGSDDRWANFNKISTKTHSQVACTDTERALFNATYFSRTVATYVSGTNSFVKKMQTIEDITRLAGKTVTVSFWARADSNKKMNIQVVDLYGVGGTPPVDGTSHLNFGNVDLTSTWTKYKLTVTLPSLIGKTLGTDGVHTSAFRLDFGFTFSADRNEVVSHGMPVGQSGTFDIAQVQLEEGSIATPFENRPYGLELSLCQRYLPSFTAFAGTGTVRSATAAAIAIPFKVAPRVPPTGIIVSGYGTIENGGTWTQMVGTFSTASITSANTLWTNGAATMTIGQGSQLNLGTNTILFTGCEL